MQQLISAFGIDWHVLIAQAINFSIVLVALTYFLYKPVFAMLQKRRDIVAKGVEDAAHAGEMLANADGEANKRLSVADGQAEMIVSDAREAGNAEKARLLKEAEARAVAVTEDAGVRAEEVIARARRESEQEIARLAILAAEKILKKKYD